MAVTAIKRKNAVEPLREIVQYLLVPELKAIKASMEGLRNEIQLRGEKQTQAFQHLSENLDFAIDIRERLASVEARLPRN
jgi:hypothetical protein